MATLDSVRERFRQIVADLFPEPKKRVICGLGDVGEFIEALKATVLTGRVEDCRSAAALPFEAPEAPLPLRVPWPARTTGQEGPESDVKRVKREQTRPSAPMVQRESSPGTYASTRTVEDLLVRPGHGSGSLITVRSGHVCLPGMRFAGIHGAEEPMVLEALEGGWSDDDPGLPERMVVRSAPSANLKGDEIDGGSAVLSCCGGAEA